MLASNFIAAATLFGSALAIQTATVVIESGSGSDLTNSTVTIEMGGLYDNREKLADVTALYLTGSNEVPVDSIICVPFSNPDGTDAAGPAFDSVRSSVLTSDTLRSIVCTTSFLPKMPPTLPGFSSSTLVTTTTAAGPTPTGADAKPTSSPTSASDTESADNSASGLYLSGELFGGLALLGFGVAFAL